MQLLIQSCVSSETPTPEAGVNTRSSMSHSRGQHTEAFCKALRSARDISQLPSSTSAPLPPPTRLDSSISAHKSRSTKSLFPLKGAVTKRLRQPSFPQRESDIHAVGKPRPAPSPPIHLSTGVMSQQEVQHATPQDTRMTILTDG